LNVLRPSATLRTKEETIMRYLSIYRPAGGEEGGMPDPEHMQAMGRLVEEWTRKGKLVVTEPLMARSHCAKVRRENGQVTVSDIQDRASGYAFLNAESREEAIELCKIFLEAAGDGETEIRAILEFAPQPQPA
jgi:hypothetical protein